MAVRTVHGVLYILVHTCTYLYILVHTSVIMEYGVCILLSIEPHTGKRDAVDSYFIIFVQYILVCTEVSYSICIYKI